MSNLKKIELPMENPRKEYEHAAEVIRRAVQENKENKPIRIYILRGEQKRTIPQLRYYWGVVVKAIVGETGYTKNEVHNYNKHKFGLRTTVTMGGEVIEQVHGLRVNRETTKKFIEDVIAFWQEATGIDIPSPEDLTEEQIIEAYNEEGEYE